MRSCEDEQRHKKKTGGEKEKSVIRLFLCECEKSWGRGGEGLFLLLTFSLPSLLFFLQFFKSIVLAEIYLPTCKMSYPKLKAAA